MSRSEALFTPEKSNLAVTYASETYWHQLTCITLNTLATPSQPERDDAPLLLTPEFGIKILFWRFQIHQARVLPILSGTYSIEWWIKKVMYIIY